MNTITGNMEEELRIKLQEHERLGGQIQEIRERLAAEHQFDHETFLEDFGKLVRFKVDYEDGRFKSTAEIARGLRALAYHYERRRQIHFDIDPYKALQDEADRPAGLSLPASWGSNGRGIRLPIGLPTVLGGYSGFGKSRLACNLALNAMHAGSSVLFFTHEMTIGQVWSCITAQELYRTEREYLSRGQVLERIREGDLTMCEFTQRAAESIKIVDSGGWSASQIVDAYNEYVRCYEGPPAMVFVDYLQIVAPEDSDAERRLQMIETMRILTEGAKVSDSAWILLSQMNRSTHQANRGRAGDHSGFQESAAIEQNAALTLQIGRLQAAGSDQEYDENRIELNISKNRFGPTRRLELDIEPVTGFVGDRDVVMSGKA